MKIVLFANTEWYLYNFRRSLATALRDSGQDVILVSPAGPYGFRLRELGFRWEAAPMERRSLNPGRELLLINWLRRLFRSERVDLVHGFTIKSAVYASLAAKLAGVPARVSSVAGMGYVFANDDLQARFLRPVVSGLFRTAFRGSDSRLILQNPDDVAFFHRFRLVNPATVRLIPGSGVDCERFAPEELRAGHREEARNGRSFVFADSSGGPPEEGSLRVLLPARLLWDKGVGEFVEAAKRLRSEERRISFLLAGEPDPGNPAAVPISTLRGWEASGLVTWLGHVEDMPALFRSVDVVALPSYREGLPKGLIEAGACGLPLVTADAPGCRDVVVHGVNGLLVPVRDSERLAAAIAQLQDDPDLRNRMGRAAREKVVAEFDERIVIERTMEVYRELLPDFGGYAPTLRSVKSTHSV
jgi:glycosyltransferase involved in cell wall biosynthesis